MAFFVLPPVMLRLRLVVSTSAAAKEQISFKRAPVRSPSLIRSWMACA